METIIGLVMMYVWVHSLIIAFKNIGNINTYEKIVCIVALIFAALYIIGTI